MPQELNVEQRAYLARYMNGVSRSFAIVAPEVDAPLADYLATAYLICRVVDNIEDTVKPFAWRQARFAEFSMLLSTPSARGRILGNWQGLDWPGLSDSEREMMTLRDGQALWQIYEELPGLVRAPIQRWAGVMASGMERSSNPSGGDFFVTRGDVRLPHSKQDYDLYCFYVAGTVGRMISELAISFYEVEERAARILIQGSDACGRALQKTNIVKDFAEDLERGYSFLPAQWLAEVDYAPLALHGVPHYWKTKVLLDVVDELEDSVNYVLALPQKAAGFRRAGLLMMLPAFETIRLAAQRLPMLFTPQHAVKISRAKMGQSVLRARQMAADDEAIQAYAGRMSRQIRAQLGRVADQAR